MTLLELFALLKKHLKLVISLPIACALATAVFSWAFLPNTYTSTVSMYVLTRANENTSVLTSTDLAASQMLTNDVATLIKIAEHRGLWFRECLPELGNGRYVRGHPWGHIRRLQQRYDALQR